MLRPWIRPFVVLVAFALAACAEQQSAGPPAAPMPVEPQPAAAQLRPGLLPIYLYSEYLTVDEMPRTPAELAKGARGNPVPQLMAGSNTGKLWESTANQLYGVHFTGLIKLEPGEYKFTVKSNDGVRVTLDKKRILNDPEAHPDRFTPPETVNIAAGGWYALTVQYFQRRGGAALELHWQPPGAAGLTVVPPEAFAHLQGS